MTKAIPIFGVALVALQASCAAYTWTEKSADGGTIRLNDEKDRTYKDALAEIRRFCGGAYTLDKDVTSTRYGDEPNAIASSRAGDLQGRPVTPQGPGRAGTTTARILVFRCSPK